MNSLKSKARRPKFELNLKIIDLNNVPLVSGTSFVKWHLPASKAAEHRGRTEKVTIKEHKVAWNYEKIIPVRLTMDKTNMLQECVVSFEVIQDYSSGARGEKIPLGHISLNLAEYVEIQDIDDEDGVTRRYLMQESKINSTLKIGIGMKQLDGERNFIAPPLKTAPVFGGISGIIDFEQGEQDDPGHMPSLNRSREAGELQDVYRRALAASWGAQVGELPADQCIENIFSGGDGWGSKVLPAGINPTTPRAFAAPPATAHSGDEEEYNTHTEQSGMLRHKRTPSNSSSRSMSTITSKTFGAAAAAASSSSSSSLSLSLGHKYKRSAERLGHGRAASRESIESGQHGSSSDSPERERLDVKHLHEIDEFEVREDLTAWRLPKTTT